MKQKNAINIKPRKLLHEEYEIYISCRNNGSGLDVTTGKPILSFDEWVNQ